MKNWSCKRVRYSPNLLARKEFQQVLDEISEILYRTNASSKNPSTGSSHKLENTFQERIRYERKKSL